MSDSVRPQRWQPTRLPRPWDSPGKNTGVGCHFLLQSMKVKSESEVAQSCPTLATPWTVAHQAPPSMGFSRQEYWSGVPLPSPVKKQNKRQTSKNKWPNYPYCIPLLSSLNLTTILNYMLILLMSVHLILFCRYCYGSNACLPCIPHTPCFCSVFAGILISKVMASEFVCRIRLKWDLLPAIEAAKNNKTLAWWVKHTCTHTHFWHMLQHRWALKTLWQVK